MLSSMLRGRSSELEALAEVIGRVRSGGSASLVIRGEPGVGKTVLLDELQDLAHDFQVLRSEGIECELQLDYARCIGSFSPSEVESRICPLPSGRPYRPRSV
jgi:hypothetical protein